MTGAYYLPLDGLEGERFVATAATTGPWSPDAQHAGPPSALVMRAVERCAPRPELQLSRFAVDVLGPVPLGEVTARAMVERGGRGVELIAAELVAGGRPVLRARAWRTVRAESAPIAGPPVQLLPGPEGIAAQAEFEPHWRSGFLESVEWRWVKGGWAEQGDGAVWARQRLPLLDGEEPSAAQRVAAVADCGNGISGRVDLREWLYSNVDLSIHLHREHTGEWVGLEARSHIGPSGAGTAVSTLFDTTGAVGHGAQALVVRPR
ncbi:thioesterase family protein [Pseudonocardia sp. CA-107938]|uniref:thioesterase family protein n=1 Tax=Pseudonocardia sp. CA-107938 TaxID=3240021 RepID=UPI003D9185B3